MAIEFIFKIYPDSITIVLPGTDFSRSVESKFSMDGGDIASEIGLIKQLTVALHRETQRRLPFKYLVLKLFDQFDYSLYYDFEIPAELLEQLASALHVHLRMRRLKVNDRELTIALWRRNLEFWLRIIGVEVIPLALMFLSVTFMPPIFRTNPALFLIFLLAVLYSFRFLGKGLWIAVIQKLVPPGYVKNLLLVRRTRIGLFDRFWMGRVGGQTNSRERK